MLATPITKCNAKNAHNNQHEPSPPYPPAALPSIAMATSATSPTLGAAYPHESIKGSRQRFWRGRGRFLHLGRRRKPLQKIEWWVWPWPWVAINRSRYSTINWQLEAAVGSRLGWRRTWGLEHMRGSILYASVIELSNTKKKKEKKCTCDLICLWIGHGLHNNQPKKEVRDE